jgi:serine/threonine protein kinase
MTKGFENLNIIEGFGDNKEKTKDIFQKKPEVIQKILEDGEKEIGEGMTAKVCFPKSESELCFKIYKKSSQYSDIPFCLSPEQESELLIELSKMNQNEEKESVRVPNPYATADYGEKSKEDDSLEISKASSFLMMERLNAFSIKDILAGNGHLPEGFSIQSFREKMLRFIDQMHKKDIYHRDLHEGNIMLNPDNGEIYVIDFGASIKSYGDEDPYKQQYGRETLFFTKDEDKLTQVCIMLRNYIKNLTNQE